MATVIRKQVCPECRGSGGGPGFGACPACDGQGKVEFIVQRSPRCPACGNTDMDTIQSNGCKPSDPDLTLLCVARVHPGCGSYDVEQVHANPEALAYDPATDLCDCGAQWTPNDMATEEYD